MNFLQTVLIYDSALGQLDICFVNAFDQIRLNNDVDGDFLSEGLFDFFVILVCLSRKLVLLVVLFLTLTVSSV